MQWSRYNHLFRSESFVSLLYNALSNTLLELDEAHRRVAEALRVGGDGDRGVDDGFLPLLRQCNVLVKAGEDESLLLARQDARQARCFDPARLGLVVCPTLRCNFRCSYCFERGRHGGAVMSPATVARLLAFIERHEDVRHLAITWYGGEPLLAFDVIRDITEQVHALDVDLEQAELITNGYLLDADKIGQLNALKIASVQITLDGPQEVHDRRRMLAGGGPTFQRILGNVADLMASPYEGRCSIRVNVDRHNRDRFLEFRADLLERFAGKPLSVHAGHVDADLGLGCDPACGSLDLREWADFEVGLRSAGVRPAAGRLYPTGDHDSVCVATSGNGFVVGPEGELCKCWVDVGQPAMAIGNVHADEPITDSVHRNRYSTLTDAYSDPACLACHALPICGGGCANKRLRARQRGEEGLEYCSPYRDHLHAYLRAYYEGFRSRELCAAVLEPGRRPQDGPGYRVVSPPLPARSPAA